MATLKTVPFHFSTFFLTPAETPSCAASVNRCCETPELTEGKRRFELRLQINWKAQIVQSRQIIRDEAGRLMTTQPWNYIQNFTEWRHESSSLIRVQSTFTHTHTEWFPVSSQPNLSVSGLKYKPAWNQHHRSAPRVQYYHYSKRMDSRVVVIMRSTHLKTKLPD